MRHPMYATPILPIQLQAELNLTRRVALVADYSELSVVDVRIRSAKLRMVEGVERLHANFQMRPFPERAHGDFFKEPESRS